MKKGIVMDVNDEYITMLTPDGDFVKARHTKTHYEIGEETAFFPVTERVGNIAKPRFFQMKKMRYAVASSLVAILFLSLFIPQLSRNEVYAYMSIDINPSFEVGLDEKLHVISLEALNKEAETMLTNIPDWKNASLDSITEKIISKSRESGYLEEGDEVLIATVVSDEHKAQIDKEIEQDLEEIKLELEKEQIAVTAVTSTVETRNAAKDKGVSTGKLLIQQNKLPKQKEQVTKEDSQGEENSNKQSEQGKQNSDKSEMKKNAKEQASEVRDELKQKKEEVRERVNENINNSNMPEHVKEKIQKKMIENREKWQKKEKNNKEKKNNGNNGKNGKDRDDD